MSNYPYRLGRVAAVLFVSILTTQCSDKQEEAGSSNGSPGKDASERGESRPAKSQDLATRASSLRQAALDLEARIGNLKKEIEESEDPSAVFKEIAGIVGAVKDPMGKYTIEKLVVQALTPGKDPVGEFQWLKDHEAELLAHFKNGSGGTTQRLYHDICAMAGMNLQASRKSDEFLARVRELPGDEISKGVSLPVLSHWLAYGNEFDKLDAIDSPDLKSSILGGAIEVLEKLRSPNTPEEATAMIETYLSPEYEGFKDPGNEMIDRFVSKKWYGAREEDIERLLVSFQNQRGVNRFLAALAYRSGEAEDGRVDAYLDQIEDEDLRNETIRKIEAVRAKK